MYCHPGIIISPCKLGASACGTRFRTTSRAPSCMIFVRACRRPIACGFPRKPVRRSGWTGARRCGRSRSMSAGALVKTLSALKAAGLDTEARQLTAVSGDGKAREEYARQTFLADTCHIPSGKLRFLQYVDGKTADWWSGQREQGAVLLG